MTTPQDPQLPGVARGNETLLEVLASLASEGYSGELMAADEQPPTIRCRSCGNDFRAEAVRPRRVRRLEGASDPDEMAVVLALTCPNCGTPGALVLPFGPSADAASAAVLAAVPDPDPESEVP